MELITAEVDGADMRRDKVLMILLLVVGALVLILIVLVIYLILKKKEIKQVQSSRDYGLTQQRSDSDGKDGSRPSVLRPIQQSHNE